MNSPSAKLILVLHSHLPFVRHPEDPDFLEESWFYEALSETYVPLLQLFEALCDEGISFHITISFSPPLLEMMADPLLMERYQKRIDALCEVAAKDVKAIEPDLQEAALHHLHHFEKVRCYLESINYRLLPRWANLLRSGNIAAITTSATHALLPFIQDERMVKAQLRLAIQTHEKHLGAKPRGIWLPECAYSQKLDAIIHEVGLNYFFVDSHAVMLAEPMPQYGTYMPIRTTNGNFVFARDVESSKQVWSAKEGYPGDQWYREFYRDRGYEISDDKLGRFQRIDGLRRPLGLKPYRITGPVPHDHKLPYEPQKALQKAKEHAYDFVEKRKDQANHYYSLWEKPVCVVAPYDAELFGHWWYEGPWFLEHVIRFAAKSKHSVQLSSCEEIMQSDELESQQLCLNESSWGKGGYFDVWLNDKNSWIQYHLVQAELMAVQLIEKFTDPKGVQKRIFMQAMREFFLAQSSDWPFIIAGETTVSYATKRVREHIDNFIWLHDILQNSKNPGPRLNELEQRNNIFPSIEAKIFQKE